jgi:hypothetical protein
VNGLFRVAGLVAGDAQVLQVPAFAFARGDDLLETLDGVREVAHQKIGVREGPRDEVSVAAFPGAAKHVDSFRGSLELLEGPAAGEVALVVVGIQGSHVVSQRDDLLVALLLVELEQVGEAGEIGALCQAFVVRAGLRKWLQDVERLPVLSLFQQRQPLGRSAPGRGSRRDGRGRQLPGTACGRRRRHQGAGGGQGQGAQKKQGDRS